jgi:branched-chain amino acid transport system substrate-binding protein
MSTHRLVPIVGVASLLSLAACGTSTSNGTTSTANCTGVVHVASDFPTSGSDASDGLPAQKGAQLAVDQANAGKMFGGCTVKFDPKDDASPALGKHDPQLGKQNIVGLVGDASVVGVVGPFNSSVALAELPIANQGNLTMISTTNTNPGLTKENTDPTINTASLRPTGKLTYFRVCTTDLAQGKALADTASKKLNARKAFLIDDNEVYGAGLAKEFGKDFISNGGTVIDSVHIPGTTKDFKDTLNRAKGAGADLIFFGGTSSNGAGIIRKQMADVGIGDINYVGGDGIANSEFFTQAGAAGNGAYATIAAPDPSKVESAKQFLSDYKAAFNADPQSYSANGFDAMNIILAAAKKAIDANGGALPGDPVAFREAVRANVAATDYNGVIGRTSFDKNGDTTNVLLTLKKGVSGAWTYDSTITLNG